MLHIPKLKQGACPRLEEQNGLGDVFLSGAAREPNATALVVGSERYSYDELEETARRWASIVAKLEARDAKRIGIFAYRSATTYIGTLAALFSGATFVPLNPRFPAERTRRMVEQADLNGIIVDSASFPQLALALEGMPHRPPCVLTDCSAPSARQAIAFDAFDLRNAPPLGCIEVVKPGDIAYLLFTSGSTGIPKGVPILNSNVLSYLAYNNARYSFAADDRFSQNFDNTFDLSIFDMFMAWSSSAALCVPSAADLKAPLAFIEREKITVWFSVPSLAMLMMRKKHLKPGGMPGLRWSLFCGEALSRATAEAWQMAAPNSTLENLYGPTELTITCAAHRWNTHTSPPACERDLVPIGRIYDELSALVVDDRLAPVADGQIGELCICGPQTFPGYWRAENLTRECTFERPQPNGGSARYYRTGDLVRRLPDGEYVFLGRRDTQIKINGYRIELGEIEAALRQSGCAEAVALPWPSRDKAKGIVAFVTGDASAFELKASIRRSLPKYMVPQRIEPINGMPLNANGKADRSALAHMASELHMNS